MEYSGKWASVVDKDKQRLILYMCFIRTHGPQSSHFISLKHVNNMLSYGVNSPKTWDYTKVDDLGELIFQVNVNEDVFDTKEEAQRSLISRIF